MLGFPFYSTLWLKPLNRQCELFGPGPCLYNFLIKEEFDLCKNKFSKRYCQKKKKKSNMREKVCCLSKYHQTFVK